MSSDPRISAGIADDRRRGAEGQHAAEREAAAQIAALDAGVEPGDAVDDVPVHDRNAVRIDVVLGAEAGLQLFVRRERVGADRIGAEARAERDRRSGHTAD